jgi:septum site-determining protein MinC
MTIQSPAQDTKNCLTFKGGLYPLTTLHLFNLDLSAISKALDEKIKQAPNFFKHAPVILDLQKLSENLSIPNLENVITALKTKQLKPIGIRTGAETVKQLANHLGLALFSEQSRPQKQIEDQAKQVKKAANVTVSQPRTAVDGHTTLTRLITTPVRSGQQIYAPGGDLIVMAPVSPGAELLADGHIHVHGALRGRALAGINGDTNAMIYCKSLEAELISVAGQYQISESLKESLWKQPASIFIKNDSLHISPI